MSLAARHPSAVDWAAVWLACYNERTLVCSNSQTIRHRFLVPFRHVNVHDLDRRSLWQLTSLLPLTVFQPFKPRVIAWL